MTTKEFKAQYAVGSLTDDHLLKVAEDPSTSVEVLLILSKHKDRWISQAVAFNPNASLKAVINL